MGGGAGLLTRREFCCTFQARSRYREARGNSKISCHGKAGERRAPVHACSKQQSRGELKGVFFCEKKFTTRRGTSKRANGSAVEGGGLRERSPGIRDALAGWWGTGKGPTPCYHVLPMAGSTHVACAALYTRQTGTAKLKLPLSHFTLAPPMHL